MRSWLSTDGRRSDTKPRIPIAAFFVVCLIVLYVIGQYLMSKYLRGDFKSWNNVEPPPGTPVHLHIGEQGEVLLEMANGQLFEWQRSQQPSWIEVTEASGNPPWTWGWCEPLANDRDPIPEPPQPVIDRVAGICPGPESAIRYEFVLSESKEVWKWQHASYAPAGIMLTGVIFLGGCGVSLLLSTLVYVLFYRRAQRSKSA